MNLPAFFPRIKPRTLPYKTLGFFVIVLAIARILVSMVSAHKPASALDLTLENITSSINKERGLRNLVTLNTNSRLSQAAQSKADDMVSRNYFSHTDPEGNYIWPKIEAAGYSPYLQLGENLAIEFSNTESLVSAWMNSPTHRANILNEGFKDQGVGLAFGNTQAGQYHSAVANTFGTLMPKPQPAPAPAPAAAAVPAQTAQPKPLPPSSLPPENPSPAKSADPKPATPAPAPSATSSQAAQAPIIPPRGNTPTSTKVAANEPVDSPVPARQISAEVALNAKTVSLSDLDRYLVLIIGVLLLVLLLADIKKALEEKMVKLDKKINNLLLLALALLTAALMYWL